MPNLKAGEITFRPTHTFIVRNPCGCAIESFYDLGDRDTTRHVMELLRRGKSLTRVPLKTKELTDILLNLGCRHYLEDDKL